MFALLKHLTFALMLISPKHKVQMKLEEMSSDLQHSEAMMA